MPTVSKKINHYSKPLPDLIQTMLKRSDNLYAEAMTKTLGKKYFNQPFGQSHDLNPHENDRAFSLRQI